MSRLRNQKDQPPDPAPELREWNEHRYDPGYYLGGNLPPATRWLQRAAGPVDKVLLGLYLLIPLLPVIAMFVPRPYNFVVLGATIVVVVIAVLAANRRKPARPGSRAARGHRRDG